MPVIIKVTKIRILLSHFAKWHHHLVTKWTCNSLIDEFFFGWGVCWNLYNLLAWPETQGPQMVKKKKKKFSGSTRWWWSWECKMKRLFKPFVHSLVILVKLLLVISFVSYMCASEEKNKGKLSQWNKKEMVGPASKLSPLPKLYS